MEIIKFYSVSDEFGEFSNFARFPIKIKGKKYLTSEHYLQAMKFENANDQNSVLKCKSPMEAARQGRDRKKKLKRNWESIKDNVMRDAVMAKFSQYSDLKTLLLSTGQAKLIEHTENDAYWGGWWKWER